VIRRIDFGKHSKEFRKVTERILHVVGNVVSRIFREERMRTRIIIISAFAALLLLNVAPVFAGGQGEAGGAVTIDFVNWVTAEESTRIKVEGIIADFESANPGISVNAVPVGFSDILNQLTVMYNSGDAPDLAQAAGPNITMLALMGALASADKVFPKDFQNDLVKSAYDLTMVDKTHYGIPWAPGPDGLWFQKDLMRQAGLDPNKPPETIYDFQDQIAKARGPLPSEIVVFGFDTTVRTFGFEMTYPFLRAFGATPFQGDKVNFNTPQIKEYMQWMRTSVENKYTLPGKKIGEFRPIAAQGRLLFMIDPSFVKGIVLSINKELSEEQFDRSWGVAALPGDKNGKHYTYASDHQLCVFEDSEHKDAAAKLAMHLVNSDYALRNYLLAIGYTPATKSALDRIPEFRKDPIITAFVEKVNDTVVKIPYGPDYGDIVIPFMAGVQEVITTNKSIDTVLAEVQEQIENIK
jgi:multiple sugar transport system substrate-binding protein